ncbi:MAG: pirin family protein [Zoogloea sp.]|nr:pirin family protein [Zoogloea sp.]
MKKLAFIKRNGGSHWVGDGFPVRGIFSYNDIADELSPFLLMDYAGPADFPATTRKLGVGQHPHRGFETVTIVYEGGVSHRDSSGGGGTIGPGDVQWMTAASGLLHEEYHSPDYAAKGGPFEMVQLWVNLPAKDKMSAPGYQGIVADDIPEVALPGNAGTARIIAGNYGNASGPARTFTPMNVWDLHLKAGHRIALELPEGHTTALFVLRGSLRIDDKHTVRAAELAVMEREGSQLAFDVTDDAIVLLLSGAPLNEPIVGHGPFVMNTREEIIQAINDFNSGRFGQIGH